MKRILQIIFALITLGCSSAAAEAETFGISFTTFGLADPYFRIPSAGSIPHFGVQFTPAFEFESATSGPGVRVTIKLGFILVTGFGLDIYYRIPVDTEGTNIYIGAGSSLVVGFGPFITAFDAHALVGFESPLDQKSQFFVEVSPGAIISGSETNFIPDSFFRSTTTPLEGAFFLGFAIGVRYLDPFTPPTAPSKP